ncbi:MAG: hypothetical protein J7647_21775 [Cyanobacteria bacterium SBLK]|nr:hypothetical protein [Cyanobacteria bacterium SBLK]
MKPNKALKVLGFLSQPNLLNLLGKAIAENFVKYGLQNLNYPAILA